MKRLFYVFLGLFIIGTAAFLGSKFFVDNNGDSPLREAVVQKVYVDYNRKFSIPKGYPKTLIPLIEGSQIAASSVREDSQKNKYYSITLTTNKPVDEVADWYKLKLRSVKNLSISNHDGFYSLKFFNQQNYYKVSIYPTVVNGQEKCLVTILISPKLA